jgi:hypothetical protein
MTDLAFYTLIVAPLAVLGLGLAMALTSGWLDRHGL